MTTFFAKGEWHAPTIVDLGIRVSRKNNTWPTFFKMIKQHPTCRVYPDVKISSKKQVDGKLRARKLRANARGGDQLRCYPVWLPDSFIASLTVTPDDRPFTDREWKLYVGSIISEVIIEKTHNALRKRAK